MKTINIKLTSPDKPLNIKKLTDNGGKEYYIIINPDDHQDAYFCFKGTVDDGDWNELVEKYEKLSEVELAYIEKESRREPKIYKHVIRLFATSEEDVIV